MSDTNRPDLNETQEAAATPQDAEITAEAAVAAAEAAAMGATDDLGKVVELIERLNAENASLKDRLIRSVAELENVRKRGEREKLDTARYAITKFSKDIIEVADTFQRALEAAPGDAVASDRVVGHFVEGVAMTERLLLTVLERHGIRRIDAKGQKFDPNLHQAVTEIPSPDVPDGHVAEVFQTGYHIEDRVLRPAMVAVARGGLKTGKPSEPAATAEAGGGEASPVGEAAATAEPKAEG